MDVPLTQILLVHLVSMTAVQSQITKGPVNSLREVGDYVTLECVTSSNNCNEVVWSKMEGAQSPKTVYQNDILINGFRDGRYSVNSTGGCSLTITQLNISDSGRFSCAFTKDASEEKRGSVLVVIDVRDACRSIGTTNELSQYDRYSFWTSINVPAKSVEPSNVILTFQSKATGETETTDDNQPLTLKTTLTGIARMVNITHRVCRASFPPSTADGFDSSNATLYVCTTQQLTVSYPVEKISFSPPSGPYYKDSKVHCTADGYPYPTFKWTHLKSGYVVYGDTLVIAGDADDKYICTASNIVTGTATSLNETLIVATSCESSRVVVVVVIINIFGIIIVVLWLFGYTRRYWPLWFCFPCFLKTDDITGLCCTCRTCFSFSFCAICSCCTYFACCMDDKVRKKKEVEKAALTEVAVLSENSEPLLTNSTATMPEKPLTEVVVSSKSAEPQADSTATVPEKPLTKGVVSSEHAKPLSNYTTTVLVKPLTEGVEASKSAEPQTDSTATKSEKPARVSVPSPPEAAELSKG